MKTLVVAAEERDVAGDFTDDTALPRRRLRPAVSQGIRHRECVQRTEPVKIPRHSAAEQHPPLHQTDLLQRVEFPVCAHLIEALIDRTPGGNCRRQRAKRIDRIIPERRAQPAPIPVPPLETGQRRVLQRPGPKTRHVVVLQRESQGLAFEILAVSQQGRAVARHWQRAEKLRRLPRHARRRPAAHARLLAIHAHRHARQRESRAEPVRDLRRARQREPAEPVGAEIRWVRVIRFRIHRDDLPREPVEGQAVVRAEGRLRRVVFQCHLARRAETIRHHRRKHPTLRVGAVIETVGVLPHRDEAIKQLLVRRERSREIELCAVRVERTDRQLRRVARLGQRALRDLVDEPGRRTVGKKDRSRALDHLDAFDQDRVGVRLAEQHQDAIHVVVGCHQPAQRRAILRVVHIARRHARHVFHRVKRPPRRDVVDQLAIEHDDGLRRLQQRNTDPRHAQRVVGRVAAVEV